MQEFEFNNDIFSYHRVEDNGIITLKEEAKKLSTSLAIRNEMVTFLNTIVESGDIKGLVVHYSNQYDSNSAYKKYMIDILEKTETISSSQRANIYNTSIIQFLEMIYAFPFPVVVCMEGHVGPDSFGLSLAHDLRIATETTLFHNPNLIIGFPPSAPLSFYLSRSLGYHKASELLLTRSEFTAREALELGLITKIVPEEELVTSGIAKLNGMKKIPGHALVEARRMLQPDLEKMRKHFDKCFDGYLKCLYKMKE